MKADGKAVIEDIRRGVSSQSLEDHLRKTGLSRINSFTSEKDGEMKILLSKRGLRRQCGLEKTGEKVIVVFRLHGIIYPTCRNWMN